MPSLAPLLSQGRLSHVANRVLKYIKGDKQANKNAKDKSIKFTTSEKDQRQGGYSNMTEASYRRIQGECKQATAWLLSQCVCVVKKTV